MPSPIPASAYPAPPTYRSSNRDLFGQSASGQDMSVLAAAPGAGEIAPAPATEPAPAKAGHPMFGDDGFTFGDFLDIINPLQHIPIVSTIYRAVTGDKIDPGSRLAGGGLFGGPIGLVASMISGMVEEATGKDPGEHALAALGIDIGPNANLSAPQTMVAEQDAPAIGPATLAATQVQAQTAQAAQPFKLGVRVDDGQSAGRKAEPGKAEQAARADAPIELPADLFQALKQTAAAQEADTKSSAINAASANPVAAAAPQPTQRSNAPMQTNAAPANVMPNTAVQPADGRTWFPARAIAVPAPTKGVGTQTVNQQTVQSRYGVTRAGGGVPSSPQSATAAAATMIQQSADPQQADWASKANDAYQKYFDMQNERNRRTGIVQ